MRARVFLSIAALLMTGLVSTGGAALAQTASCVDLLAGRTMPVGEVCVGNDADTLQVVYTTTGDWELAETHVAVGSDEDDLPQNRRGNPRPGHFPYSAEHDPTVSTVTYSVDLAELGAEPGDELALAAHAVVTRSVDGTVEEESAWADGDRFVDRGNWATYLIYTVQEAVVDADGDGFDADVDCDDTDPDVYPGAPEEPNDGIDQDCDGEDLVLGSGDIQVTLQWESTPSETVDMDLYVIDPNGDQVAYYNTTVASGGELDRDDDVCGSPDDGQSIENVFWADDEAITGTYTVGVDEYGICSDNTGGPADWTLTVRIDGVIALQETGTGDDDPAQRVAGTDNTFTFDYPAS